jgi:ABC-2 type transport system permease protein
MSRAVLRYEGRRRVRSALGLSGAFALMALAFVAFAPLITTDLAASAEFEQVMTDLPRPFVKAFGLESLASLEGLLAGEFYTLFWSVFFGLYLAATAAGSIRGDIDADRMDVLLSNPVSRTGVLLGTFCSLLVPISLASVVTPAVIYVGTLLIDASVSIEALLALHLLSIPYLLCCGAIGLVLSVFLDSRDTARNAAIGLLFSLYLLDSFVAATDVGWLASVAPMHYFDANAILVGGSYDLASAGILLVATALLVALSGVRFGRMDVQ